MSALEHCRAPVQQCLAFHHGSPTKGVRSSPVGGRTGELDGVRGIAIGLVVVYHATGYGIGGPAGVTLFFVLSGYLITGVLTREMDSTGALDLRRFWARRLRRIVPALVPVVAVALTLDPRDVVALPIMNYALATGREPGILQHTWSLAVEEQFYLLWPVIFLLLARRRHRMRLLVVAASLLAAWGSITALVDFRWSYYSLDGNAYAFLLGALGALTPRGAPRHAWAGCAILLLAAIIPGGTQGFSVIAPLIALAALGLVVSATHLPWLGWPPLRYLGRLSYGLYLWHVVILVALPAWNPWLACMLALGVAAVSWHALESPLLSARRETPLTAPARRPGPTVWRPRTVLAAEVGPRRFNRLIHFDS